MAAFTPYELLIASLADARPYGYQNAGQVRLTRQQLDIALTHEDIRDAIADDDNLVSDMLDELNSVYSEDSQTDRAGAKFVRYARMYAEGQVFEDVRSEIHRREDAEVEAEDSGMPATESTFERMGTPAELL